MNRMKPNRRIGFTLIELLVVIAIIGVLFVVAMPVFENAGRKDPTRAAYQLMTTLRLARQHAINKRQFTAVVFPVRAHNGGVVSYGAEDLDKCLRSYAVLAVTNRMDGLLRKEQTPDKMDFIYVSDWKYLPPGIYFDDEKLATSTILMPTNVLSKYSYPLRPGVATPGGPAPVPMAMLMFKPNGRAYQLTTGADPYLVDQDPHIHLTSAKYYEKAGTTLDGPKAIPGSNVTIMVRAKSGQVVFRDK